MDGNNPETEATRDSEPDSSDPINPDLATDLLAPETPTLGGGTYRGIYTDYKFKTGSGNDTVVVPRDAHGDVFLGDGDDAAWGGERGEDLRGGARNDSLFGGGRNDDIRDVDGESSIYGGAGDGHILASNGSTIEGGDDADNFDPSLSQYCRLGTVGHTAVKASIITDFDPAVDTIYIEEDLIQQRGAIGLDATISIQAWSNGFGADILADDEIIARVHGGQTLRVEDLMIAGHGLEEELLSHH